MTKFLAIALVALAIPAASSAASINLSTTVGSVSKSMGVSGAAAKPVLAMQTDPCFGGNCSTPTPCVSSPENPTALLGVLGAAGLFMGRFGYGRLRNRTVASPIAA